MRIRLLLFFSVLTYSHIFAQQRSSGGQMTLDLYHALKDAPADTSLSLLIQGDTREIISFVAGHQGNLKYSYENIVAAQLPVKSIRELANARFVSMVDCPAGKYTTLNDVMIKQNNVDSAYMGFWPLNMPYDGSGVIIGIIDAPFDIYHGDFEDENGHTRIRYMWDQTNAGTPPAPYTYGTECDSIMLANGTCTCVDDNPYNYSHGTGVTGVAASSGMAANRYRGVAPNAELILVSLNMNNDYATNLSDAVNYIYQRAAEMGKPCVINTSVGAYVGSHDGTDLTSQVIDGMISAQSGRALVAAAGNAGNASFHLGYDVTADEQFTWFKKLSYMNLAYFQLWADSVDLANMQFRIMADDPAAWTNIGSTPYYNVLSDYAFAGGSLDSTDFTIPGGGNVKTYIQHFNGKYLIEFAITPDVATYYWRFSTVGSGHFDIWASEGFTGFSNYVITGLPDPATLPDIVHYQLPNTDETLVSSWQCSDKVITVGSYVNRDTMTNYYGEMPPLVDPVGALFYSSSHGPTRDGRIKPDICATGARLLSSGSQVLTDWLISLGAANYMSTDGMHYLYNGTSFSSPVVAGVAALYLQKHPDADYAEIKNAIITQAKQDTFTGDALPNNSWGYGKVDAFRTLTGPWGCSADDYSIPPTGLEVLNVWPTKVKLTWDIIPNATGYSLSYRKIGAPYLKAKSLSTTKTISGLTANSSYTVKIRTYCDVYGFSNWSPEISFTTPMRIGEEYVSDLICYPNPANNILFAEGLEPGAEIKIYDITGRMMLNYIVNEDLSSIDIHELPQGMYAVMMVEENHIYSQKIMIAR